MTTTDSITRLLHREKLLVIGLVMIFVAVWLSPPLRLLHGIQVMPLWLHTLMETFAITIAAMTFGVVWNAHTQERSGNLVILACAFLATGLIDFAHTLSYRGMPDFITPAGVEKGINFWLVARMTMAVALLVIALRSWCPFTSPLTPRLLFVGALVLSAFVWWLGLFHQDLWPRTFIEGQGLTPFKVGVEYLIIGIMVVAVWLFHRQKRRRNRSEAHNLRLATVLTILGELCFTLYSDVTDLMNLLGHIYKVVAYYFFYLAVFVECVNAPFRRLRKKNEEHRRTESALGESERHKQLLFEMSPTGLVLARRDGTIVDLNPAYAHILGRTVDETRQLNLSAITAPEYADLGRELFIAFAATGHYGPVEKEYMHKDGYRVPVRVQSVPIDKDGEPHIWSSVEDISAQKASRNAILMLNESLERRVAKRTQQLTDANKELEAFSYSVSHDLRAPLRAIDGFSQVLIQRYADKLDETGRDYLSRVRRASQRMGELIDDLLQLSRMTRTPLRRQEVDLSALAAAVLQEMQRAAPERQVRIHVQPDLRTFGDPGLLRAVLDNLLGNAWKFTRHTENATIEFACETRNSELLYSVRDNGAGFDNTYANKLFQVFQRLHSDSEFEGTGIGLATVARIIRRHDGAVCAEGALGKGATFYFTLPQRSAARIDGTDNASQVQTA